ncbi:hypothetical protein SAMN05444166_3586 [Singulisphaera sp. GP187]|nr:hypothetical protein SAMN05444166_3586 [Singulisphaera sp. GP187]
MPEFVQRDQSDVPVKSKGVIINPDSPFRNPKHLYGFTLQVVRAAPVSQRLDRLPPCKNIILGRLTSLRIPDRGNWPDGPTLPL